MKNIKSPYMSIIGWGMFLTGAFMFASCADDDIIESTAVTTGDAICFSASKTRSMWEPDQTRSASSKEKQTLHCEAADGDFSVDVTVEDGIRSCESSQQVHSRGTQISEVGGWSYKVGAYYFFDESVQDESGTSIDFFSENSSGGLKINTDNNKNNAAVTTSYYWPPVGEMKFFAVAPADVAEATGATFKIPALANVNTPTLTYTIPSNVAEQKDIMVAQSTVACQTNNSSVDLQFEHLLAAVQFKVGKMQFIKINSLSIEGVQGGTVTMTYDNENRSWSYTNVNENNETSTYYSIISTPENGEPNIDTSVLSEGAYITDNENGLMLLVMPQSLGKNQKIKINYTEIITSENEEFELTFETIPHNWEAGKTTTYICNIDTDITNIEIPSPPDADAHYVRVDIDYDLTGFAQYADKGITISNIVASTRWLDDGSNTASDDKKDIFMKTTLTEMQSKGFFTDELWELRYSVGEDEKKIYTKGSEDGPELVDANLLGTTTITSLTTNSKGKLYLFLDENNGTTDRNGEILLTADVISNNKSRPVVLGRGKFKQLCPSWNMQNNIGIERFENDTETTNSFSYGFNYGRVVRYTSKYAEMSGSEQFWQSLWQWFLSLFGITMDTVLPNVEGQAEGFVKIEYTKDVWRNDVIHYIELNYTALNAVEALTINEDYDGLGYTRALYNYTGATDITELENQLNKSLGFNAAGNSDQWTRNITQGTKNPEYYAAFIALKRNRMREFVTVITANNAPDPTTKAILHKVGEGGTDKKGDESGENIIEWYLPSSEEAKTLFETGTGEEKTPISPLNGTYWSSTPGSDIYLEAYTYKYTDNKLDATYGTGGVKNDEKRESTHKVRAVRKKPQ